MAGSTPKKTPTSSMHSRTDRFTLPGGVYSQSPAPPPGAYEPRKLDRGTAVSMVQKMVRRRQSRGLFADVIRRAAEMPSPMQYEEALSTMSLALSRAPAWSKNTKGRFDGHDTLYAKEQTPDPGKYNCTGPLSTSKQEVGSASFSSTSKRFEGTGAVYFRTETPGVGSYDTNDNRASTQVAGKCASSSFASSTDRFALPDGVYSHSVAPPPGAYEPRKLDPGRAASMMQRMVRRRQSRGVFADVIKHASEIPGPLQYQSSMSATSSSAGVDQPSAWSKPAKNRFEWHDSVYARSQTPGVGEYDPAVQFDGKSNTPSVFFKSGHKRFDGPGSVYAKEHTPGVGAYETMSEASRISKVAEASFRSETDRFALPGGMYNVTPAPAPGSYEIKRDLVVRTNAVRMMQKMVRRRQSRGIWADAIKHASEVPCWTNYAPASSTFLSPSIAKKKPVVRMSDKSKGTLGRGDNHHTVHDVNASNQVVALPVVKEAPFNESEVSNMFSDATCQAMTHVDEVLPQVSEAEDGEALFCSLMKISAAPVDRHDYYDNFSGWDILGLKDDLEIARSSSNQACKRQLGLQNDTSLVGELSVSSNVKLDSSSAAAGTATALSQLTTYLRAFCFSVPAESSEREQAWNKWDQTNKGALSYEDVDLAVKKTLQGYSENEVTGLAIWKRFHASVIYAFNDAKGTRAHAARPDSESVTKDEFRLLSAFLGYYATWFEVFGMIDGQTGAQTTNDNRFFSQAQWEAALDKVVHAGLTWAPYVALRSATKASFGQMKVSPNGAVSLAAFCSWIKLAEVKAKTSAGVDLSVAPASA